jgi:Arylsulfotransferase (ASST)
MKKRTRLSALALLPALLLPTALSTGHGVRSGARRAVAAVTRRVATVTISPLPGTPAAMPRTQISFLGASAKALRSISVVGSRSGRHGGRLRSYASAVGASFLPSKPFTPGESVSVHARWRVGRSLRSLSTHFTVAHPVPPLSGQFPATPGTAADMQGFQSRPDLHPPRVTINQSSAGTAPGYVFAAPFLGPGAYGPMIFDNAGRLVWFRPLRASEDAADLQVQRYRGKSALTWWQGKTIILGYGLGEDVIANANYRTIAVVKAGNGLPTDEHEFTVLPNGAALVTAYSPVRANLSAAGGPANGIAVDCAVQEIDIHTGLVMWEWHSMGHVDVTQSYSKPPTSPGGYYDYFHVNSAQQQSDGNFLISARNTWGIYELNAHTGQIIWQLGGKKSTFRLGPNVQFAYQHNALMLPNGEISVFDDEGAPAVKPPTRGELIKLDSTAKTAALAGQFVRTSGPLITASQGNVQSLPNGNWMLGWGGLPNFTEFDPQGQIVFDGQFPKGEMSYRVYRAPWTGRPSEAPAIAARAAGASTTVYASWNGATAVASWQLMTGSSPKSMKAVSTTPKSGFETTISGPAAPFVQVRALGASGGLLGQSRAIKPTGG